MNELTAQELIKMPDVNMDNLSMFVNVPKGYVCKRGKDWESFLIFNPDTNHVIIYYYYETTCYVSSASDEQANGHFNESQKYTAK